MVNRSTRAKPPFAVPRLKLLPWQRRQDLHQLTFLQPRRVVSPQHDMHVRISEPSEPDSHSLAQLYRSFRHANERVRGYIREVNLIFDPMGSRRGQGSNTNSPDSKFFFEECRESLHCPQVKARELCSFSSLPHIRKAQP